ncbi:MAG TPA: DUF4404 family protein [Pyrinomonadaceae bacterium]|nr:DUF4404 family protein [Pyrinomonadaceae bacterium]
MNNEQLRTRLEQLQAELQKADAIDPQQREKLQARANEIEQLLKREEIKPHDYTALGERLSEDVAQLEASHPQITLLMRGVIDSLAYLGI